MKEKNFLIIIFLALSISIIIFKTTGFNICNYTKFNMDNNKYTNIVTNKQVDFVQDNNILVTIDDNDSDGDKIILSGWAVIKGEKAKGTKLLLKGDRNSYLVNLCLIRRKDVTAFFGDSINYDNSGFMCRIDTSNFQKDNYVPYIAIKSDKKYLIKRLDLN